MLQIGKASKFYTLWDVTTETRHTGTQGNYRSYEVCIYTYYQNLSTTLEEAQAKAKTKGCTDLEPNEELKGKRGSWERVIGEKPKENNFDEFPSFFWLSGQKIMECTDLAQLWKLYLKRDIVFDCKENQVNPHWRKPIVLARRRLADLGVITKEFGEWGTEKFHTMRAEKRDLGSLIDGNFYQEGARVDLELTYVSTRSFVGQFGTVFIDTFKDAENRKFIYKGGNPPEFDGENTRTLKATIKHGDYKGTLQTFIQRIKF